MILRAIQTRRAALPGAREPPWLGQFRASLAREDLSAATLRGYLYDLRHFLRWHASLEDTPFSPERLAEHDLIAYRQQMIAAGRHPATVNRRLEALRRLGRWAHNRGMLAGDVVHDVRAVRMVRNRRPVGLTDPEVHAMLRAAGASGHGLAARNYALVQLMLQTGIRVGELAMLRVGDVTTNDRSGNVRLRHGKGLKEREVPLNATARRAIRAYLDTRSPVAKAEPLFLSNREGAMPVRSIQAVISAVARRARLKRVPVSAHTLRHVFALGYLRDNPGKLVELATLLGHESLDTTAVYTRPSDEDLAADLERSHLNVDG